MGPLSTDFDSVFFRQSISPENEAVASEPRRCSCRYIEG